MDGYTWNCMAFRSRLEATWCAFFEEAGILWAYRPDMGGFFLHGCRVWAIILDREPSQDDLESALATHMRTGNVCVLLAGAFGPRSYKVHTFEGPGPELDDDGTIYGEDCAYACLCPCRRCDGLCVGEVGRWDSGEFRGFHAWSNLGVHNCGDHDREPVPFDDSLYHRALDSVSSGCPT